MEHTSTKRLYEYWDQVRNGRFAPNRFEIEPARLADILPDIFILECQNDLSYRFRLAGTRICNVLGHELRQQNLLDYWDSTDREGVQSLLHTAKTDGAGVVAEFTGKSTNSAEQADFEMLVLPLVHTDNAVNRMLGSIAPLTHHYWAGTQEIRHLTLTTFEFVWPDTRPPSPLSSEPPVLLNEKTPSAAELRSRFRVLEGGLSRQQD
ncbi:MAG: PAS domain-containing protein [Hyphomicrobiaceae bacterium]|nr:PAS domain-containing protein [Hyphomicrobiaceae bacterium]